MSNLPKRTWVWPNGEWDANIDEQYKHIAKEYVRKDISDQLVEALKECEAEIDNYIRQEYRLTDHPIHERYRQRDFAANPARIALAKYTEAET